MRRCQGNSLFLSPTTQKLHNSIEKASKDTQTLYTTKSLREARKNIIALVDHILQQNFVQENPIAAEFVSQDIEKIQLSSIGVICPCVKNSYLSKSVNNIMYAI